MKKTSLLFIGAAVSVFGLSRCDAAEWFVDAQAPAGTGDGKSAETAFHTIQEGVNAAGANDTVWVAPGTYDEGTSVGLGKGTDGAQLSRVVIDKPINLFSTGSRDDTFILGSYAGLAKPYESTDAVQCICITEAGAGSVIKGFTLRDGVLRSYYSGIGGGGVVYSSGGTAITPADNFYVVLCHIDHCVGRVGGAMAGGGWAIATLFTRNWSCGDSTSQKGSAIYKTNLYNCIFADNGEDPNCNPNAYAVSNPGVAVNCTVVNNFRQFGIQQNSPTETSGRFFNVAAVQNVNVCSDGTIWLDDCVIEGSYGATKSTDVTVASTSKSDWAKLMMAPILGDYRPIAGGLMDNAGNRAHLALVPEAYRDMDFNGNDWDSSTADVPVGAILPAATPVATPTYVENAVTVNGRNFARSNGRMYLNADVCPLSVYIQTNATLGAFHSFAVTQYGTPMRLFADSNGGCWYTLAEEFVNGIKQTESKIERAVCTAGCVFYVDEKNGDDDNNAGTSPDAPFATLAKASSLLESGSGKSYAVFVAPGTYASGVCDGAIAGHKVRFSIPGACHVWLVGTGGRDVTFIEGAPDGTAGSSDYGCGPDAVGGVDSPNNCNVGICGFTFRNCRTLKGSAGNSGAACCLSGANQHVFDCDFEDNVSWSAGAAVSRGHIVRCRFRNNMSVANYGTAYGSTYCGCVFSACSPGNMVLGLGAFYNCTIDGTGAGASTALFGSTVSLYNCLLVGGGTAPATSGATVGNVFWGLDAIATASGYVVDDPKLAGPWRGDYRPLAGTKACTEGGFNANIPEFARYATSDVDGNPLFPTGSAAFVGAVARVRASIRNYYVDATNGNDANDGLSAATAKKTLVAALGNEGLGAGDTVLAAAGTYDAGTAFETGVDEAAQATAVPARVVVWPGVTLKSADGPAATVIRGEAGVRCAFVESGATLSGFTLAGAVLTDATDRPELRCAGVCGRGYAQSRVENCILDNLLAHHRAAAGDVTLDCCKVLRASATINTDRSVVYGANLYNTLIDHCRGNPMIENYHEVVNVTVGYDNLNYGNDSRSNVILNPVGTGAKIVNSLFLQKAAGVEQNVGVVSNSLFVDPIVLSSKATLTKVTTGVVYDTIKSGFDADYRPRFLNTAGIDGGDNASVQGTADLLGAARIQHGTVDLGAYEYEFRPSVWTLQ